MGSLFVNFAYPIFRNIDLTQSCISTPLMHSRAVTTKTPSHDRLNDQDAHRAQLDVILTK